MALTGQGAIMSTALKAVVLAVSFTLLGGASLAFGQVYSWVDENGKKHFGDRIPPQYQDQADEYDLKETNSSQKIERVEYVQPTQRRTTSASSNQRGVEDFFGSQAGVNGGSCEAQKAAYKRAQDCWAQCRTVGAYGGRGGGAVNASHSACRSCQNLPKPKC